MKRLWYLGFLVLTSGCALVRVPVSHPPVSFTGLITVVSTVDRAPIPTLTCALVINDDRPTIPCQYVDSRAHFTIPTEALGWGAQLTLTAEGYRPSSTHVDHLTFELGEIDLRPVGQHVDPSTFSLETLAKIRGAMWTVRGPWPYGPRPGQPDNITALGALMAYGDDPFNLTDTQKAMLDTYTSWGYTHVPFGPIVDPGYHGQYPAVDFSSPEAFERWLDWLQVLWDHGIAPICFLAHSLSFDDTVAEYDHLIRNNPRAQALMRIIVPTGWEPTRYDWSSVTWKKFCDWGREILPHALILIHTVADTDAPVGTDERFDDNGKGNAQGWARIVPSIHGWLIQSNAFGDNPNGDPTPWAKNNFDVNTAGSYGQRFRRGYAGWPTNSLWGDTIPIKLYAGEFCSYWEYWQNRPYAECVKWGDAAIQAGADGVLDSSSIAVP